MTLISLGAELEKRSSTKDIWTGLLSGLSDFGIDFAIYLTVSDTFQSPTLLTNIPSIYVGVDPSEDPFLEWCCHTYEPTRTGGDYLEGYDYLPQKAKDFISQASKVGFRTGIGIPVRLTGSTRFGGFNLGTRYPVDVFERNLWDRREELRGLCLLVHRRLEEIAQNVESVQPSDFRELLVAPKSVGLEVLSPREREIVYLIAQGLSRKECAKLCGISHNTVHEYTKSAYRKLGISKRVEAARLVLTERPANAST